jgi:hypothetical protein
MNNVKSRPLYVAVAASLLSTQAVAIEPASINVGNLALTPTLEVKQGYTDNLFDSVDNEKSTSITTVRPSLNLQGQKGGFTAGLNASLEHGIHYSSRNDDYTDKALSVYSTMEFSARTKLDLIAEYLKLHDARDDSNSGDALTTDEANKASRYTTKNLGATLSYGTRQSDGQIVLKAEVSDKQYDNFREYTAAKDRQTRSVTGTFFYRVSPKTRLLVEGRLADIDYDLSSVTRDSFVSKLLVGAEWDATAKTTGSARFGIARKDFDSSSRDDFTGANWEFAASWSPRTYSIFDITTNRAAEDASSGEGDYIDTTSWTLGWSHEWNERVGSRVSYNWMNEDYVDHANGREDDTETAKIGLTYDMRRWLTLGVDVSHVDFDSNLANSDYKTNKIFFTVEGSL